MTPSVFKGDGKVSTEYTFWCAGCERWEQFPSEGSKQKTMTEARRHGWLWTRAHGWLCRRCVRRDVNPG